METMIAYEQVAVQVEKMFVELETSTLSHSSNEEELVERLLFIDQFINACGWCVNDYWIRWANENGDASLTGAEEDLLYSKELPS
jgi:hypothetical protein